MAEKNQFGIRILEPKELLFAKSYALNSDPVKAMRAAGHTDPDHSRTLREARKFLANDVILEEISHQMERVRKTILADKVYIIEKTMAIADHCVEIQEKTDRKGGKYKKMVNPADAVKALNLLAEVQGLKDIAIDNSNKILAQVNIQLNNKLGDRHI